MLGNLKSGTRPAIVVVDRVSRITVRRQSS